MRPMCTMQNKLLPALALAAVAHTLQSLPLASALVDQRISADSIESPDWGFLAFFLYIFYFLLFTLTAAIAEGAAGADRRRRVLLSVLGAHTDASACSAAGRLVQPGAQVTQRCLERQCACRRPTAAAATTPEQPLLHLEARYGLRLGEINGHGQICVCGREAWSAQH